MKIYVSLNFLKNELSVNTFSYDNNQLFYKNTGLNLILKTLLTLMKKCYPLGF